MACLHPLVRNVNGDWLALPCGKCSECIKKHQKEWVFRLYQQFRQSARSSRCVCLTLTYDNQHIPLRSPLDGEFEQWRKLVGVPYESYFSVLHYRDVQLMLKKVRKKLPCKIKYFCCGEYGGCRGRAHYHMLVFGLPSDMTNRQIHELFYNAWQKCIPTELIVDEMSENAIRYCTKYLNQVDYRDHVVKPFVRMSKHLGLKWLSDEVKQWIINSLPLSVSLNGYRYPLPRYYRKKALETPEQQKSYTDKVAALGSGSEKLDEFVNYLKLRSERLARNFLHRFGDIDKCISVVNYLNYHHNVNGNYDSILEETAWRYIDSVYKQDAATLKDMASRYIEKHFNINSNLKIMNYG